MGATGSGMIEFTHDIQIAHRLFLQPGKCQKIHGHSMVVILSLVVKFDNDGYAVNNNGDRLEFGEVKKHFRHRLDTVYDHHLLLNEADPWAGAVWHADDDTSTTLPGLHVVDGDPSTENLAKWIAAWCADEFDCMVYVEIKETHTNAVMRSAQPVTTLQSKPKRGTVYNETPSEFERR